MFTDQSTDGVELYGSITEPSGATWAASQPEVVEAARASCAPSTGTIVATSASTTGAATSRRVRRTPRNRGVIIGTVVMASPSDRAAGT